MLIIHLIILFEILLYAGLVLPIIIRDRMLVIRFDRLNILFFLLLGLSLSEETRLTGLTSCSINGGHWNLQAIGWDAILI